MSLVGLNGSDYNYVPQTLAFDSHGNAWVSAVLGNFAFTPKNDSLSHFKVAEFAASDVAGGGTPAPVLTLAQVGFHPGGYGPGLAFDAAGNLWTANVDIPSSLTQFAVGTLTLGANPAPTITITSGSGRLDHATDVAVDSTGALLVAIGVGNVDKQAILRYLPNQLTASTSQPPAFSLVPSNGQGVHHLGGSSRRVKRGYNQQPSPPARWMVFSSPFGPDLGP